MEDYLTDMYSVFFRYDEYDRTPVLLVFEMYKDFNGDWCADHDVHADRYDFTEEEAEGYLAKLGLEDWGRLEEWDMVSPKGELSPEMLGWNLPQGALDMIANLTPYEFGSQEPLGTDK